MELFGSSSILPCIQMFWIWDERYVWHLWHISLPPFRRTKGSSKSQLHSFARLWSQYKSCHSFTNSVSTIDSPSFFFRLLLTSDFPIKKSFWKGQLSVCNKASCRERGRRPQRFCSSSLQGPFVPLLCTEQSKIPNRFKADDYYYVVVCISSGDEWGQYPPAFRVL